MNGLLFSFCAKQNYFFGQKHLFHLGLFKIIHLGLHALSLESSPVLGRRVEI
jgi:hypothetical protein